MDKVRILIIEDDEMIRENLTELLELSGYDAFCAINGIEGVKAAKQVKPSLILCDIMMPEMDGYGVLYAISQDNELSDIPFIFLTAKTEKEHVRKGISLGADDYLTKPCEVSDLLGAIEIRLKKRAQLKKKYGAGMSGLQELAKDSSAVKSLETIIDESRILRGKKNDCVYREGAIPREIFYLRKGNAKKVKLHEDGKELLIEVLKEGDFFGVIPVINNTEYTHSVVAMDDYEVVSISQDNFNTLFKNNSEVRNKFIKILAGNIEAKELELLEIAYGTVRSRLADGILRLLEIYPNAVQEGIPLSRGEMAQFIGTAHETLIRTVSEFKKEGLISMNGMRIVPNVNRLKALKY